MFDWQNIPADLWEKDVPVHISGLVEQIWNLKASFAKDIRKVSSDLLHAGEVGFSLAGDETHPKIALFDLRQIMMDFAGKFSRQVQGAITTKRIFSDFRRILRTVVRERVQERTGPVSATAGDWANPPAEPRCRPQ